MTYWPPTVIALNVGLIVLAIICFRRRSLSVCAERSTEALFDGFGRLVVVPPMALGNMRQLGAQNLIASCLNDACRHTALIDVSHYPAETEVSSFRSRVACAKCGSRGNKIDVRPN